jgi:hypothetical protein
VVDNERREDAIGCNELREAIFFRSFFAFGILARVDDFGGQAVTRAELDSTARPSA